jgi:predicted transcriptional regulator
VEDLLLPCEVGVKTVLPAVKAIMAREIVEKHGFNEQKTAELLGLSQSAVSRYVNKERGNLLLPIENSTEILTLIDQMVTFLIKEPNNKTEVLSLFCQTCKAIRKKGLMCPPCQKEMPQEWAEKCFFCR